MKASKELGKKATYWDKRRLETYRENEKLTNKQIKQLKKIYKKANKDIDKMLDDVYRNYSKNTGLDIQKLKELLTKSETKKTFKELQKQGLDKYIKNNYKARITRLEQIKAQVYAKAKEIYPQEELKDTMLYRSVINNSYYKAIYNVQNATGLGFQFNRIDDKLVNTLLNNKWSGKNYSQRIWGNTDILANEASTIIGGALLSGQGIEKTARQLRERFNVASYYAERLARTEMNYFDNQADKMAYEEMGISEYVCVTVLDNRTSLYCIEIDQKHFPYSEIEEGINYPPFHPNCRCTTRGYLGKEAEKLLERRARNPITDENEIISNMSYKQWYNKNVNQFGKNKIETSAKKMKNETKDKEQYKKYIKRLGKKNIGSFDNFREIKYNKKNQWENYKHTYRLKKHYDKVIDNGDLSALVDFDLYQHIDKTLSTKLNGITTVNDITVKNHSLHFIDRVFGSIEQKRDGVNVEDIKTTLKTSTKTKEGKNSIKIYGNNNIVSINPETGNLIQVNPF